MEIKWPTADTTEIPLPDELTGDPFYDTVTVTSDGTELSVTFKSEAEIKAPLSLMTEDGLTVDMMAETIAVGMVERMAIDLKAEVLGLIRRKVKDALNATAAAESGTMKL